ncbi:MAG: glycosyltransferase family 2 protein [Acidobacteriaceae bacterium]|jgi:cellulose synthase/poly-beta-1,6-N-acetylglucosamine synthase-like glycosyltransferase
MTRKVAGKNDDGTDASQPELRLSVIIPARNEAALLGACLGSLLTQSERGFALGAEWELIVVDDDSSDGTREIALAAAAGREGVAVISAPPLDLSDRGGFTGKTNACWAGAQVARGAWLLFTDADTVHQPGNLSRAIHEAEKYKAALLSYSPRQIVTGFWQRAVMPLVFSELASVYPPRQVSSSASPLAAANGQFLLVERDAYFSVGGHRVIGREILEDVALAQAIKRRHGIRFRYAPDALSTRMYRTLPDMVEGWTKNLALLFPNSLLMAGIQTLQFLLFFGLPALAILLPLEYSWQRWAIMVVWLRTTWGFYGRVARAHFPAADTAISILGVPLFVFLLIRSYLNHRIHKSVAWKGRSYKTGR